ncbi:MAG: WYL domain-containing protein, partial [Bacteroidales bacterium]|nr:WYL domain-containing protein [Bacteroidales bacterium]
TDTILKAIDKKLAIELIYNSLSKNEDTCRIVEPVGICHYSFNWHLIAYCKLRNDYRDFRIDRIKSLNLTNEKFTIENKPVIRDYFNAITSDHEVFLVKLVFEKDIISEISQAKYYYGFIDEIDLGDKFEMSFLCNSNDYIGRWIITLLDKVEIIEPESLKSTVTEMIKNLQKKYLPS